MLDKYEDLNLSAKDYSIDELDKIYYEKYNEEAILKRCHNEINLFDEKGYLFIIEILYKFKKENKNVFYHFRGMINNSLLLYILGLSKVNPLEYNLPYELITDKTINVDLIGIAVVNLIDFISKNYYDELKSGNIIDLDLVLKDGEYYIFDKAGGGNNRMILMKLKYLALKEKTLDKEKLDEEFSFCGNIRMSPPEEIAKNIFYFMFPNGGYRESCYQIINKSNDITNPLFQIVTNYPSNPIIIQDSLTYEELSHLEENFVDKNKAK